MIPNVTPIVIGRGEDPLFAFFASTPVEVDSKNTLRLRIVL